MWERTNELKLKNKCRSSRTSCSRTHGWDRVRRVCINMMRLACIHNRVDSEEPHWNCIFSVQYQLFYSMLFTAGVAETRETPRPNSSPAERRNDTIETVNIFLAQCIVKLPWLFWLPRLTDWEGTTPQWRLIAIFRTNFTSLWFYVKKKYLRSRKAPSAMCKALIFT